MDKDSRISAAVAELTEVYGFIIHLTEISREQTVQEVTARAPSFMEQDKARENPPSKPSGSRYRPLVCCFVT